jgi:hypothetical protein
MRSLILVGASSVADWYARTGIAGLVVIAILVIPLLILISSAILVKPRNLKVTGVFLALLVLLFGGFIGGVYVLSKLLGLFF